MFTFVAVVFGLLNLSIALNPLNCNGVAYEWNTGTAQGTIIYAEPADACQGDTYTWVSNGYPNFSFMYYCFNGEIRRKQWWYSNECSGQPDEDKPFSEVVTTLNNFGAYVYNCSLQECEYAEQRIYFPFDANSVNSCDTWTPTTVNSGWVDDVHIRGYCYDYGTHSNKWRCQHLQNGLGIMNIAYPSNTNCYGKGNWTFSVYQNDQQCVNYQNGQRKEDWECKNVSTPAPIPNFNAPMTTLNCNAVEFEFSGGKVTYPVDRCIYDSATQQSVLFYCDNNDMMRFHSWGNTHTCDGTPQNTDTSFQYYIDSQPIQSQFGQYTTVCGQIDCDYIIVRDYTYTGACDAFVPDENSAFTDTYFIRDYCLEIGTEGSMAWGCDLQNQHATELSFFLGVTDCSDMYAATLDWYDLGAGKCVMGSEGTNYIDVHCYTGPTPEPTKVPTDVSGPTSQPTTPGTARPTMPTTGAPTNVNGTARPTMPTTGAPTSPGTVRPTQNMQTTDGNQHGQGKSGGGSECMIGAMECSVFWIIIVVLIVLLFAIIIAAYCYRKKNKNTKQYFEDTKQDTNQVTNDGNDTL